LQQLIDFSNATPISVILCAVLPSSLSAGTQLIKSSFGPTVDLGCCIYRETFTEPASSYIVKNRSTGTRTIVNYNELPEMTSQEFIAMANEIGDEAGWYHFEVVSPFVRDAVRGMLPLTINCQGRIPEVTSECIQHLRQCFPAVKISVEVEKPGRVGLQELAAEADVVFYSKSWALVTPPCLRFYFFMHPVLICGYARVTAIKHQKSVYDCNLVSRRRRRSCLPFFSLAQEFELD